MLAVIGRAYLNLGRGEESERMVQRAIALQTADTTVPRSTVIASLQQLATVQMRRGDYTAALATIDSAIALQAALAPVVPAMLGLLADRANVSHGSGDLDAARDAVTRALAVFDSIPPAVLADSIESLRRLTTVLAYAHANERVDAVHARLITAEQAAQPDGENVATAYRDWARVRQLRGDLAAADSLLVLALAIHRRHGLRSAEAAGTMTDLAEIASTRGQPDRAVELFRSGIALLRERLGSEHMLVSASLGGLAEVLKRAGRHDEAVPLYREVVAAYARSEETRPYVPVAEWRLADALRGAGRLTESLAVFERALAGHEAAFPPGYVMTAYVRRDYGRALLELGRERDARPLLEAAVAAMAARWGEDDARVAETRALLARAGQAPRPVTSPPAAPGAATPSP